MSSPPIVIRWSTPSSPSDSHARSRGARASSSGSRARCPGSSRRAGGCPRRRPRRARGRGSVSPSISHLKPSRMPITRAPRAPRVVAAAPITPLMPGAGPPPTRIPNVLMLLRLLVLRGASRVARLALARGRAAARRGAAQARAPGGGAPARPGGGAPGRGRAEPRDPRSTSTREIAQLRRARCVPRAWCRIESGARVSRVQHLDARAAREVRRRSTASRGARSRRAAGRTGAARSPSTRVRRSTSVSTTRARSRRASRARGSRSPCRPPRARTSRRPASARDRRRDRRCSVSASRSLLVSRITSPGHSVAARIRRSVRGSSARALSSATSGGEGTKCTPYCPSWITRARLRSAQPCFRLPSPGSSGAQREHAIDDPLVVEADDQHRQVLAQRAHEMARLVGERRLADPALVRGDGEHGRPREARRGVRSTHGGELYPSGRMRGHDGGRRDPGAIAGHALPGQAARPDRRRPAWCSASGKARARPRACASVIVATEDARIADACRSFGAEVAMTRADHETGTDRLAEVARAASTTRSS